MFFFVSLVCGTPEKMAQVALSGIDLDQLKAIPLILNEIEEAMATIGPYKKEKVRSLLLRRVDPAKEWYLYCLATRGLFVTGSTSEGGPLA